VADPDAARNDAALHSGGLKKALSFRVFTPLDCTVSDDELVARSGPTVSVFPLALDVVPLCFKVCGPLRWVAADPTGA
jgi:hypothetical protein